MFVFTPLMSGLAEYQGFWFFHIVKNYLKIWMLINEFVTQISKLYNKTIKETMWSNFTVLFKFSLRCSRFPHSPQTLRIYNLYIFRIGLTLERVHPTSWRHWLNIWLKRGNCLKIDFQNMFNYTEFIFNFVHTQK